MNKDDYFVLKHIVGLIPNLDLSDKNSHTYGLFADDWRLSVYAVNSHTYAGYNRAGAIIFSTIDRNWHPTILEYIANYGTNTLDCDSVQKLKGELRRLYLVKLDKERKRALMGMIKKYKIARLENSRHDTAIALSASTLTKIKNKHRG